MRPVGASNQRWQLCRKPLTEQIERQRLDKWLWAARFYKTRSTASSQIQKGRVSVNGQRGKPSRLIGVGDQVIVQKIPYNFEITVIALNEQRRSATEAQTLYEESAESIEQRTEEAARRRAERAADQGLRGEGRPTKRQRRQIIRFRNQGSESDE